MNRKIFVRSLLIALASILLTGCLGISPRQYKLDSKINPDLSGVFVLESQFTQSDLGTYANTNNIADVKQIPTRLAGDVAKNLGWTFPYEVSGRQDENNSNYFWLDMGVKFSSPDTFCRIFPSADMNTKSSAAASLGIDNILNCKLESAATPYTDVIVFQNTIFPNNLPGTFSVIIPGSVIKTNGAFAQNAVTWSWNRDAAAVPLQVYMAGLSKFNEEISVKFSGGKSDLVVSIITDKDVVAMAQTMYPQSNPATAIGERVARGLGLTKYTVDSQVQGPQEIIINIKLAGLTDDDLLTALEASGLMSNVKIVNSASIVNDYYDFVGVLNPWHPGFGYPDSIVLNVSGTNQASPQSWTAKENALPMHATGNFTNWPVILGVGGLCVLVLALAILLIGGLSLIRRKKA